MEVLIIRSTSRNFPFDLEPELGAAGHTVVPVSSLQEYVSSPARHRPQLIVIEIGTMPDIDRALLVMDWNEQVQPLAPARYVLLMASKYLSLGESANKLGSAEIAVLPQPTRNLLFKLELQSRLLLNAPPKQGKIAGFSARHEESQGSTRKRVLALRGQNPRDGTWQEHGHAPSGKVRWRWVKPPAKAPAAGAAFTWTAESKEAPRFDEKTTSWLLEGADDNIVCQHGDELIYSALPVPSKKSGDEEETGRSENFIPPENVHAPAPPETAGQMRLHAGTLPALAKNTAERYATDKPGEGGCKQEPPSKAPPESVNNQAEKTEPEKKILPASSAKSSDSERADKNETPVTRALAAIKQANAALGAKPGEKNPPAGLARNSEPLPLIAKNIPLTSNERAPSTDRESPEKKAAGEGGRFASEAPIEAVREKLAVAAPAKLKPTPLANHNHAPSLPGAIPEAPLPDRPAVDSEGKAVDNPPARSEILASKTERAPMPSLGDAVPNVDTSPSPTASPAAASPERDSSFSDGEPNPRAERNWIAGEEPRTGISGTLPNSAKTRGSEHDLLSSASSPKVPQDTIAPQAQTPPEPERKSNVLDSALNASDQAEGKLTIGEAPAEKSTVRKIDPLEAMRPTLAEADQLARASEMEEPGRHFLKTRHFELLSLEQLSDQESSWHPAGQYRIYLSAQHRYYGLKDPQLVLPLWIYDGELAPEFIDEQRAWKFYDRLPVKITSLNMLPVEVLENIYRICGIAVPAEPAKAAMGKAVVKINSPAEAVLIRDPYQPEAATEPEQGTWLRIKKTLRELIKKS